MPLFKDKIVNTQKEKEDIEKKVYEEHVQPTEEEQKWAQSIIGNISQEFSDALLEKDIDELRDGIIDSVKKHCTEMDIPFERQMRIEKTVLNMVLGHGPIEAFLQDPSVTEIVVPRYDNIVIERNGKIETSKVAFTDENHLQTIIKRIVQKAGRQINLTTPIVDSRLKDGSRVNATIPPVSPDGATLTIRKFNNKVLTGSNYLEFGSLNRKMLYFLERCVRGRISVFVSGGTGTGKTTLLNMLSLYVPADELIITIEDTCELKLQQPNVRRMEVRNSTNESMMQIDQKELVKNALRQRPDRIILGEVRDGSVVDLISAMSSGHEGSLSTIHANNPKNMCDVRLPILYSMNRDVDFSEESIAMQIAEAIQIVVQINRFPDGSRKITQISHVNGLTEKGKINIQDIFFYNRKTGEYEATGYVPKAIVRTIKDKGLAFDESVFKKEVNKETFTQDNETSSGENEKTNDSIKIEPTKINAVHVEPVKAEKKDDSNLKSPNEKPDIKPNVSTEKPDASPKEETKGKDIELNTEDIIASVIPSEKNLLK